MVGIESLVSTGRRGGGGGGGGVVDGVSTCPLPVDTLSYVVLVNGHRFLQLLKAGNEMDLSIELTTEEEGRGETSITPGPSSL